MSDRPRTREELQDRKIGLALGATLTFGLCLADAGVLCMGTLHRSSGGLDSADGFFTLLLLFALFWFGACVVYLLYQLSTPRARMGCLLYFPLLFTPVIMAVILPGNLISILNTGILAGLFYLNYLCLRKLNETDIAIEQTPHSPPPTRLESPPLPDPMDQIDLPPGWDEQQKTQKPHDTQNK